jgi:hypothetical protein
MPHLFSKDAFKSLPFFFIIGRSRSGTTLLMTMFDAHPNVIMPFECNYIILLRNKYEFLKYWTKSDLLTFYDDLFKTGWRIKAWNIDKEKLKSELIACEGEVDYETICKVVHSNYISVFDKQEIKIIGDKNPKYAVKLRKLMKLFPDAKYVHIIRDYRDHLLSMLKLDFLDSIIPQILFHWKYSAKLTDKMMKKHPGKFYSIKYEDLATKPIETFTSICIFLGLEFNEASLDFYKKEVEIKKSINTELFDRYQTSLFNPIDASRINTWHNKFNDHTLRLADALVGKIAERYGYERTYKKPGLGIYFKIFPRIVYLRSYNFYLLLVNQLPRSMGVKIKSIVPKLGVLYYKFFPSDKIK